MELPGYRLVTLVARGGPKHNRVGRVDQRSLQTDRFEVERDQPPLLPLERTGIDRG